MSDVESVSKQLRESGRRLNEFPITLFHLRRKILKGSLILPNPTKVWTNKRKSEYIESIYLNYPLAWFYSEELDNGKLLLRRGVERALAILEYFDGKLKPTGLKKLPILQKYSLDEIFERDDWLYEEFAERKITLYASSPGLSPEESDDAVRISLWQ